jgi:hypothetical protein
MNVSDAFNSLKNKDHSTSFEGLGPWLDQQSKGPKPMRNMYKIAASLVATALILVACTVPVESEEEIGYMIRGLTTESAEIGKGKISSLSGFDLAEIQFTPVIHEMIHQDGSLSEAEEMQEVVLILPESNHDVAVEKVVALEAVMEFSHIEIMPIESTVERTFFESTLHKTFDIKIDPDLSEAQIASRINTFLHENSSITETIEVKEDENGNRHAVFVFEMGEEGKFEVKRDIEQLYNDLTPGNNEFISEDEVQEMKEQEIQKMEEERQRREDQ